MDGSYRACWMRPLPGPSPSPEQLLDIAELQFDEGWAAVVALAGVGSGFHLTQQGVHFFGTQFAAGADGVVAGHGGEHVVDAVLDAGGDAELAQLIRHVAHDAGNIRLADGGGDLADDDGAIAKRLEHEASLRQQV